MRTIRTKFTCPELDRELSQLVKEEMLTCGQVLHELQTVCKQYQRGFINYREVEWAVAEEIEDIGESATRYWLRKLSSKYSAEDLECYNEFTTNDNVQILLTQMVLDGKILEMKESTAWERKQKLLEEYEN